MEFEIFNKKKKILVVSPFLVPQNSSGFSKRIFNLGLTLNRLGYEVHFLYSDLFNRSKDYKVSIKEEKYGGNYYFSDKLALTDKARNINPPRVRFAERFYRTVNNIAGIMGKIIQFCFPKIYYNLKDLPFPWIEANLKKSAVETSPKSFINEKDLKHTIDSYYPPFLDRIVRELHRRNKYDAVFSEYVFFSKALENFDNKVLKVIDTMDIFTDRNKKYKKKKVVLKWFFTTLEEEIKGLNRADVILAIQDKEKAFFEKILHHRKKVITAGHMVRLSAARPRNLQRKNILFLGDNHEANVHGINHFIKHLFPRICKKVPAARLILAGAICDNVIEADNCFKLGKVKDVSEAYNQADAVISPIYVGTGLKIKCIEALGFCKPLVMTPHSAEGFKLSPAFRKRRPFILAKNNAEFVNAVVDVLSDEKLANDLSLNAFYFVQDYNKKNLEAIKQIFI